MINEEVKILRNALKDIGNPSKAILGDFMHGLMNAAEKANNALKQADKVRDED